MREWDSYCLDGVVSRDAGPSALWASRLPRVRQGSKADRYLTCRGVGFVKYPPALRQDRDGNLVALIQDPDGATVSYQRTFLEHKGGLEWRRDRKIMRNPPGFQIPPGSSIRLGPTARHMGCAEGTESALSAYKRYGVPTWSTISSQGMATWVPPVEAGHLTIFTDLGLVGERAANALRFRCHEIGVVPIIRQPAMLSYRGQIVVADQNTLRMRDVKAMAQRSLGR